MLVSWANDMLSQPVKSTDEEIRNIAKLIIDNYDDCEIRNQFFDLSMQL